MKQKFFIDTHKGATAIFVLICMAIFNQWQNPTAWVYLALHGTYGILWIMKSAIFPDQSWEQPINLGYGLATWAGLTLYWVTPVLICVWGVQAPGWYLGICISIYAFGVFFHFTTDMQKYLGLKLTPGRLITDGLFAYSRNMNYFGELLIYLGFGLLAMHWLPVLILLVWVTFYWYPRMQRKDKVLATLPGFQDYKQRAKLFIPYLF